MTHTFDIITCHECGEQVAENWHVRHLKADCKKGIYYAADADGLTTRQRDVLRRLAYGIDLAIALELGVSVSVIKTEVQTLYNRFGLVERRDRVSLLRAALRSGEIELCELVAPAHVLGEAT